MNLAPLPVPGAQPGNRAVLYLRQSKEREDSESIETQEYLGREYCEQRGYEVVAVHVDRVSGRKWDARPGVIETMRLVEERRADVIVVWKWSRLSRNRLHWAVANDRVGLAGGRIESVTEPIDTSTACGRFARGVMTEYAAFQSESMGEIWGETLERRVRKGLLPSGGERYGYVRDGDTYTPHPVEAPVLVELFTRYVSGTGWASVARWANEAGHRTRRGNQWTAHSVRATFDAGFAAGLIRYKGTYHPGAHPAIITREMWDAYQARLASNVTMPRGKRRMLSGLLRCTCGRRMHLSGRVNYRCDTIIRGLERCEDRRAIRIEPAEKYVLEWLEALPARPDGLREAADAEAAQRVRSIENRAAIERRIAAVNTQLSKLAILLASEKISQAAYEAGAAPLEDELESLRARHVRSAPTPRRDLLELIPKLVDGFADLPSEAQNQVLRRLIRHITVLPAPRPGHGVVDKRVKIVPVWSTEDE